MKKQVIVVGLGRFGVSLAANMSEMGHDVLALDTDEQKVQSASGQMTHTVQADATNESVLRELGAGNFDIAIVAIGTAVQNSVLATILLKRLGVPYVIARASSDLHGEILDKIGADRVVYPEHTMGQILAHEAILGAVSEYMPVVSGYGIAKVEASPDFVGQTLSDLGVGPRGKLGVAVLIIQREKDIIVAPGQGELVKQGDTLIVAGNIERLVDFLPKTKPDNDGRKRKT
ncbi:MAG: TrkA family potassium uptake protein [Dehalococcoidales bacterium]|nr:TrkA family potassium uptake protein [Dehalococcoidales bacterium]